MLYLAGSPRPSREPRVVHGGKRQAGDAELKKGVGVLKKTGAAWGLSL